MVAMSNNQVTISSNNLHRGIGEATKIQIGLD